MRVGVLRSSPRCTLQVVKFLLLLQAEHSAWSTSTAEQADSVLDGSDAHLGRPSGEDAALRPDDSLAPSESVVVPLVVLLVGAAAAMFLCVMLRDQLRSLLQGVAKIDRLQQLSQGKNHGTGGIAAPGAGADVPTVGAAANGAAAREETVRVACRVVLFSRCNMEPSSMWIIYC